MPRSTSIVSAGLKASSTVDPRRSMIVVANLEAVVELQPQIMSVNVVDLRQRLAKYTTDSTTVYVRKT